MKIFLIRAQVKKRKDGFGVGIACEIKEVFYEEAKLISRKHFSLSYNETNSPIFVIKESSSEEVSKLTS